MEHKPSKMENLEVSKANFWRNKRVLVTGATGLVGSWVCQALSDAGANVVALIMDHDPQSLLFKNRTIDTVHVVTGELQDYRCLERAISAYQIDTIFHFGAQALVGVGMAAPYETFESNIKGTYNLLEAARLVGGTHLKRIVVASSDKAYGDSDKLPYTEDMPVNGRNPYDVSKSCTDLLSFSYASSYDLPIAVARCGNIFGGGDLNFSRIVPGTIKSILADERPVIRSDGTLIRDYIYIRDIVSAYLLLAEHCDQPGVMGEAFNFSLDSKVSVAQMVDLLRKVTKREDLEPVIMGQAAGEIRNQYLSSEKAKCVLGWRPDFSLEDGLHETFSWYKNFLTHEN